jgi:hypothetical protein
MDTGTRAGLEKGGRPRAGRSLTSRQMAFHFVEDHIEGTVE